MCRRADRLRQPQAAEDLHSARIAALHLRPGARREVALDQNRAHAATRQLKRQGEANGASADDAHVEVAGHSRARLLHWTIVFPLDGECTQLESWRLSALRSRRAALSALRDNYFITGSVNSAHPVLLRLHKSASV